ncbi:MAG TPA: YceI family protein [Solirubrobacteraceae bacterium]|jgi:polyisoprenoid-binding protein YceI|nr:YceI family protein [Solirubrobacteraceae bacterium]
MNTILSVDRPQDQLAGTRWQLDPAGSTAEFHVPNLWGLVKVHGRFSRLAGQFEVDEHGEHRLDLKIDAASVETGNRRRDAHLRSADFFDVGRHPEIGFRSTRVTDGPGEMLRVEGELRAGGERIPLELEVAARRTGADLEILTMVTVDQRALGMTASPLRMIRTPTTLTVHARLQQSASE